VVPGLPCRDHGGAGASLRPGRPLDAGRGAGTAALGGAEVGGCAEAEGGPWLGDPWGYHDFNYMTMVI